jgi:outer membrane protein assembly factor BamE (lipoprotein component of BamABCDE complex)
MAHRFSAAATCAAMAVILLLAGCDPQRISELEEGETTEADVRARFGQPEQVWDGPAGARILEYNRQPAGQKNYMITIGADGRMSALRQVLHPGNFARVLPGMMMEDVRKLLGKPARVTPYALKDETAWDWRYLEPANTAMVFTVWFNPEMRVLRAASAPDPLAPENR